MAVGRKKKHNKHLPRGVTLEHGAYYYRGRDRKRVRLGSALGEALAKWATIVAPEPSAVRTMHHAFERFRLEVVPRKAAKTQKGYLYMLPRLDAAFGHVEPKALRPTDGYAMLDAGREKPTQALKLFNLMSSVLTACVKWGVIERNPFWEVRKGDYTPPSRSRCPTDAEFDAVYAMASERVQIAMDLAVLTGLRLGGILRLELGDVTPDGLLARLPGKKSRALLFVWTQELRAVVERAQRLEPRVRRALLCTGKAKNPKHRPGQPYTESGFGSNWQRLMRAALEAKVIAEPFTFHDLRAKSATDAETDAEAAARLGHTSPATTKRVYIRKPAKVQPLIRLKGTVGNESQ